MLDILLVALRIAPNIVPLGVIILGQHTDQIVHEEHRVVVPKHVPPDPRFAPVHGLLDDPGHPNRRPEAPGESVREPGGVLGDYGGGEVRGGFAAIGEAVEEGDGAGGVWGVPEAEVRAAAGEGEGGGGDGEEEVAAGGRGRGGGLRGEDGGILEEEGGPAVVGEEEEEDAEEGEGEEEVLEARRRKGLENWAGG